MPKQASIKEIAEIAGVSPGTVDRILHNRGNVSEPARIAVETALAKVGGYRANIHTSAVSMRKKFVIGIITPTSVPGDYWSSIQHGFSQALDEYSDLHITCIYKYYDQFDSESCQQAYDSLLNETLDAVVIGPTFESMTVELTGKLDKREIPYVFVDSKIDNTNPWSSFTTDQRSCGLTIGRLLLPSTGKVAVLSSRRAGKFRSTNSILREEGMIQFFKDHGCEDKLIFGKFSAAGDQKARDEVKSFLKEHPDVNGIAILNSRGYIVADAVKSMGINDIRIACFDLTKENRRCMEEGSLSSLICQRPEDQGFNAIHSIIELLIYKGREKGARMLMPIDVIFAENLRYYRETARMQ